MSICPGTVDGNQTRRDLIDSQISPSGGLYGIILAGDNGLEPLHGGIKIRCLTNLANPQQLGGGSRDRTYLPKGPPGYSRLEHHCSIPSKTGTRYW